MTILLTTLQPPRASLCAFVNSFHGWGASLQAQFCHVPAFTMLTTLTALVSLCVLS